MIGRQCRHTTSNATGRRASSQLGASIKSFSICRRAQAKFQAHRADHLNGPRAHPTQLKWLPQQVSLMLSRECTETPISLPFHWPWADQHYDGDGSIAPDFRPKSVAAMHGNLYPLGLTPTRVRLLAEIRIKHRPQRYAINRLPLQPLYGDHFLRTPSRDSWFYPFLR